MWGKLEWWFVVELYESCRSLAWPGIQGIFLHTWADGSRVSNRWCKPTAGIQETTQMPQLQVVPWKCCVWSPWKVPGTTSKRWLGRGESCLLRWQSLLSLHTVSVLIAWFCSMLGHTASVLVKDLRLKDEDKDLISKDEESSFKDKDLMSKDEDLKIGGQRLSSRTTTLLWGSTARATWTRTWPGHNGK